MNRRELQRELLLIADDVSGQENAEDYMKLPSRQLDKLSLVGDWSMDSLDMLEFITKVEKKLGIHISDECFAGDRTFGEFTDFVLSGVLLSKLTR